MSFSKNIVPANLNAFLDCVAFSEIGPSLLANPVTDDGYLILVGSTPANPLVFKSFVSHPNIFDKALNSDAAGRYQLMARYFEPYKKQLLLPDFGPRSQDRIAIQLIHECHAFDDIIAGNFSSAIIKCNSRWASLPGSQYMQHENSMAALQNAYTSAGGSLA
jgi:muramidase (phage lysozyme)